MTTKKRTVMEDFEVFEVSGVDFPAMEGAKVTMMKRKGEPGYDPKNPDPKKRGRAPVDKVLPKRRKGEAMSDFVDRFMANKTAREEFPDEKQRRAVAETRKDAGEFEKTAGDPRLTSNVNGHSHMLDASETSGRTSHDLSEGEEFSHSHPWVKMNEGSIVIGMADGHTHEVLEKKKAPTSAEEPGDSPVAGGRNNAQKERDMTKHDATKSAADQDQAVTQEQFDALKADNERLSKLAEMSDGERAHYKGLSDSDKESFLKLDADGRKAEVEKATAEDPVVYKDLEGNEYRKSDDPRVVSAVKRADAAEKAARLERDQRIDGELAKRADGLTNLKGDQKVKKGLLRAIDGIEDEDIRKGALEMVEAANSGLVEAFKRRGTEGSPKLSEGSPEARYEKLAQEFAKSNNCTIEKARAEVLMTEEGNELYAEMTGQPVMAD